MNNTKKRSLTAIAAILMAATLVVGTAGTVTTKTAFAASSNNSGNTVTIEECKNRGSASGFDTALDQECENLICTHPGENATCVQEGAAALPIPTPVKKTCEQCFTSTLTAGQISEVLPRFGATSFPQLCNFLHQITEFGVRNRLSGAGVSETTVNEIIACLLRAGIVFAPPGG
jgi:hypothetical protein